ncbi:hypothetical protein [Arthrobacter sp. KNU40]|uniref:hypothetical protein n=1 Tax=Arthrobacter sp. KNU40 TaxID=3447965 RepID=UPI003F5F570C
MNDEEKLELIEEDLAGLIQDEGLTPTRLEAYGKNIIMLFGVKSASFVDQEVKYAMLDMPKDKYTTALQYALSVYSPTSNTSTLTERRAQLMTVDGFAVSEDTLRRWERRAMKTFARHIIKQSREENLLLRNKLFADEYGSTDEKFDALARHLQSELNDRLYQTDKEVKELRSELDWLKKAFMTSIGSPPDQD